MSTPMKNSGEIRFEDRFPPEVFAPCDDVTPEAVKFLRDKAEKSANVRKWKLVDGFGLSKSI